MNDAESGRPAPFSIQPHDPLAVSLIRVWIIAARCMKVNPDKLAKAEAHLQEIRKWQRQHGTKVPD